MDHPGEDGLWVPGLRRLTSGLVLTVTLIAFESLSVATILPVVSRHLGDVRLYGWVFSAFFLASLAGIIASGFASDRRGPRLPLAVGLVVFAVGLAAGGAAPNMGALVAARCVQGFGAGMVPAAAYVAISRAFPTSSRPKMFAVLSTAWVVPGLAGPAVAAQIASLAGWRWVFLGLLPLVGVAGVMAVPALSGAEPAHDVPTTHSPLLPALVVTAGAGMLLAGIGAATPATSIPLVVLGGASLILGLRPLTPVGTLTARPGIPTAVLIRGLLTFAYFAGDAYVPLELTSVRHTSTTFAGLTLTVATITWTTGSWVQARLVRQWGPRVFVTSGLLIVVGGLGGMAALLSQMVPLWSAFVAWGVGGFGIGLAYSPTSLIALGWAQPGREGEISASIQLTDVLGTALGTGMTGTAVAIAHQHGADRRLALGAAFALAGLVAIAGTALAHRLPATTEPLPSLTGAE